MRVTNSTPLGSPLLLPFVTVNHVTTLKAYWPAKVLARDSTRAQSSLTTGGEAESKSGEEHLCHFFGTYDVAWIDVSKVADFAEGLSVYKKKCRTKAFARAIGEAQTFLDYGTEPEGFTKAPAVVEDNPLLVVSTPPPLSLSLSPYFARHAWQPSPLASPTPPPVAEGDSILGCGERKPPPLSLSHLSIHMRWRRRQRKPQLIFSLPCSLPPSITVQELETQGEDATQKKSGRKEKELMTTARLCENRQTMIMRRLGLVGPDPNLFL
jgi:hypothetical protein